MWYLKEKNLSQSENEVKANWWNHKSIHSRGNSPQSLYYSNWSIQWLSIQPIQSHYKYWQRWWVWKWWKEWMRIPQWIQYDKANLMKSHYQVECYKWILFRMKESITFQSSSNCVREWQHYQFHLLSYSPFHWGNENLSLKGLMKWKEWGQWREDCWENWN